MEYKILQENTFGKPLKQIVLENRELTNNEVEYLLNPTSEYIENPFKIKNIDKGIELFISELDNENQIGLIPDCDVDGYTSSALVYQFLINECQYPKEKITWFIHEGKEHGLSDEKMFKKIKKSDINFLIIPDAGTNDIEQIKELLKLGKKVLVLDHHQMNNKEQNTIFQDQNGKLIGVIINNQLDEYSKEGSGVFVVHKFFSAMCENPLIHYLDLVAIGCIADVTIINDFELRYFVNEGLKNINNEFFKELIIDAKLEGDIIPTDVSFNIANKINATIRYGTIKEKTDLFRAMIGEEEEIEYTPRKSKNNPNPQTEIQTLQKAMVRMSKSIKQKQDKAKKKHIELCVNFVKENNLNDNKAIVIIDEEGKLIDRKITGLIAMGLVDTFKKSVILLSKGKDKWYGSLRGYGVESLKEILESTEIVTVKGHHNSAGVEVENKDIPRLIKRINRAFEGVEVVPSCTLVDCVIDAKSTQFKELQEIYNMRSIWNSHCSEPVFLIKDAIIDSSKVRVPYATLITFEYEGIQFKKEYCSGAFKKYFLKEDAMTFGRPMLKCNLIVKVGYDDYRKQPCFNIVIAESEIVEKNKKKNDKKMFF